jgi:hypothetical protein
MVGGLNMWRDYLFTATGGGALGVFGFLSVLVFFVCLIGACSMGLPAVLAFP